MRSTLSQVPLISRPGGLILNLDRRPAPGASSKKDGIRYCSLLAYASRRLVLMESSVEGKVPPLRLRRTVYTSAFLAGIGDDEYITCSTTPEAVAKQQHGYGVARFASNK